MALHVVRRDLRGGWQEVEVPRPECPSCLEPMVFWSGYSRFVRHEGVAHRIWVPRGFCGPCGGTHALLPAFASRNRLDSIETIGTAVESVVSGVGGVRPAARRLGVPHSTARGWLRSFGHRARALGVSFAALTVELGGAALTPLSDPLRHALGGHDGRLERRLRTAGMAGGRNRGVSARRCAAGRSSPPTRTPST